MELITHLHVAGVSAGDICWAYAMQQLDYHKRDKGAHHPLTCLPGCCIAPELR